MGGSPAPNRKRLYVLCFVAGIIVYSSLLLVPLHELFHYLAGGQGSRITGWATADIANQTVFAFCAGYAGEFVIYSVLALLLRKRAIGWGFFGIVHAVCVKACLSRDFEIIHSYFGIQHPAAYWLGFTIPLLIWVWIPFLSSRRLAHKIIPPSMTSPRTPRISQM